MRKRQRGRKLSRTRDQRKALLKTLAVSLILRERIKTTEAKAKELAPFVEKKISKARIDSVQNRRFLMKFFPQGTVKKLMGEIAPKYKERKGGYTRIIKLGARKSDGARMAIIELVK